MIKRILFILLLCCGLANANPPGTYQPLLLSGATGLVLTYEGSKTDNSVQTTYTYTSSPVGSGTRKIVISVLAATGGSATINSATVDGNAMTAAVAQSGGTNEAIRQFYYDASSSIGSSVTITVTFSAAVGASYIDIYTLQNAALGAPSSTVSTNSAGSLTLTMSSNCPAGGAIIGTALSRNNTLLGLWSNLTENSDYDVDAGGNPGGSASATFAAAQTGLSIQYVQTGAIIRGIYGVTTSWTPL